MSEISAIWQPAPEFIQQTHLAQWMKELNISDIKSFHRWSIDHYEEFWSKIVEKLPIIFKNQPEKIVDFSNGIESPSWFPGAIMNIADSCFQADPEKIAVIAKTPAMGYETITYGELNKLSNRIANTLVAAGFTQGAPIAIIMPMDIHAVAIYLGIIKMGGVVVSIPDSFSITEMKTRLDIAQAKAIFTQQHIAWDGKTLPLHEKVKSAATSDTKIIVVPQEELSDNDQFTSVDVLPMTPCNILFSSGTTATPKAIPWNHTTPIKVAADAYLHQDIHPNDILAWPTNLGWMMGPWLIFAALINHATIALYTDTPKNRAFGEFVQDARITMLGVVPTLVGAWHHTHCMEGLDWSAIKCFSSTGECSNPTDMAYLMSLAGNKPIIEYCGGTEIGGAYISSTLLEPNYPSMLSTPTMGLDFVLLGEEVAIIPPSIGLSTTLLNANHHDVYYADMPTTSDGKTLRRHGDQIKQLKNGYYQIQGRVDDAMNLGGIKTSSAEIERITNNIDGVAESAAIAIAPPDNGPSQLIIYVVPEQTIEKTTLIKIMQKEINQQLNPLFKIHDILFIDQLPKTASNKIMRRVLRERYSLIHSKD